MKKVPYDKYSKELRGEAVRYCQQGSDRFPIDILGTGLKVCLKHTNEMKKHVKKASESAFGGFIAHHPPITWFSEITLHYPP